MIKKILLIAALLAPHLAYGANPTANLSVQIVPAGSAPPIPVGAQAAGFTTPAANYDFTQPMPANWLGCQPWDGQKHLWYQSTNVTNPYDATIPCEITQGTDPQNPGTTALVLPWKSTYNPALNYINTIQTMSPDFEKVSPSSMVGPPTFPNAYYEYEFRVQPSAPRNNSPFVLPGANIAAWMMFAGSGNEFNAYEGDTFEIFDINNPNAQPTSTIHDWGGNDWADNYFTASNIYDARQYHKWAMRRTSDGTTTEFCTYLDGQFQACSHAYSRPSGADTTKRWGLVLQIGMTCAFNNGLDTSCFPAPPFSHIMYIKTARVWSCANWQTTMCNGTALSGAP